MPSWRSAALLLCLALFAACHGSRSGGAAGDSGLDGPSAAASALPEAGPPPDDAIPATSSDELTTRSRHLLEAIAGDNPDLAADILFPREAWLLVRDAADPGREWSQRVERPFQKSLHAISRHHLEAAQFVSIELGHAVVQEPLRKHGWSRPLWSVHGSRLTYVVEGHTRTVSIREMTAWRGAWYVTRLR